MSQVRKVSKKLVTVRCHAPFRIGHIPFAGICNRVTLSVEDIASCIEHKALVVEHLLNGQEIPLGFDNFDTYNGPTAVDDESPVTRFSEPEIEMINGTNKTILNVKREEVEVEKEIPRIDLDKINREKEEEEAKAEAARKAKEEEDARKAAEEKQREEQRRRDEEEAKKAMDAVLAREKEASERKNADSGVVEISIKKSEDVVAEEKQETVVAEIDGTLEVASEDTNEMPSPAEMVVPGEEVSNDDQQYNKKKDKKNKHH